METVAIIGPVDTAGKAVLHKRLSSQFQVIEIDSEEEYHKLDAVNYTVLRTLHMSATDMAKAPKLKLIQRWGAGYDTVDIQAAGARNIQVSVASGLNAVSVSEYAVMLMLAVYRHIVEVHNNILSGGWRDKAIAERSYSIAGKTVGLIGLGNIGKRVARLVQSFGAKAVYYDVKRLPLEQEKSWGIDYLPLELLLQHADIVSLHVPLTKETHHMINKNNLVLMKPTAILINTARGGTVDENDLADAIREGKLLGAGMDVLEQEPPAADHPLINLKGVVLSSHNAGTTADNSINMANRCADNIFKVSEGKLLTEPDLVNKAYLKIL